MEKIDSKKLKNKSLNFNYEAEINNLANHPLLKGYQVDINNYNMFYDYITSYENCKKCKGLEFCKNTNPHYIVKLEGNPPNLVSIPCKYLKEAWQHEQMQAKFNTLYTPESVKSARFDDVWTNTESRLKAKNFVINLGSNFKTLKPRKGLYLYGNFQIGKTYFLAATANYLASLGIESLLIFFPDLIRVLKSIMYSNKEEYEEKINMLKTVPVLMLDDLGAEYNSEWVRDEILCPILNYRLQENLPLFISSNLDLKEMLMHYQLIDKNQSNAERLISRIKASSIYLEF